MHNDGIKSPGAGGQLMHLLALDTTRDLCSCLHRARFLVLWIRAIDLE